MKRVAPAVAKWGLEKWKILEPLPFVIRKMPFENIKMHLDCR